MWSHTCYQKCSLIPCCIYVFLNFRKKSWSEGELLLRNHIFYVSDWFLISSYIPSIKISKFREVIRWEFQEYISDETQTISCVPYTLGYWNINNFNMIGSKFDPIPEDKNLHWKSQLFLTYLMALRQGYTTDPNQHKISNIVFHSLKDVYNFSVV